MCHCPHPCTPSKEGRTVQVSMNHNLRLYPGVIRDTNNWLSEYKLRPVIERNIFHFKDALGCGNPKTRDVSTIKTDMLLAGIAQLITVVLADKMNNLKLLRSLRPLIV